MAPIPAAHSTSEVEVAADVAGLGAINYGAKHAGLYLPLSSRAFIIVPPPYRFLSQPPLAQPFQSTNLTLESPIGTRDMQEQGILYVLLNFHAWTSCTIGALLKSLFVIRCTTPKR